MTDNDRAREREEFFFLYYLPICAESLRTSISYFLVKRI